MIEIIGLTKVYRRGRPPALSDLSFDAHPGTVTALLGPTGAGKTTAIRLMVEAERGQGVTLFHGRTYRRLRRPERTVGVMSSDDDPVVGHPDRRARGHLRMLAAAAGVRAGRADVLLEQTCLASVAHHRLRSFSSGMRRRLALAGVLLGGPDTLLLDCPTEGLSPRNVEWFHAFMRSFGASGGTVVFTTRSMAEASLVAHRVITLDGGRTLGDQPVRDFRRARVQSDVAVRGPQMARLADLLIGQGVEVLRRGGTHLSVSGIDRAEIGELAYRHGILLHELADHVVERPLERPDPPAGPTDPARLRTRPPVDCDPGGPGGNGSNGGNGAPGRANGAPDGVGEPEAAQPTPAMESADTLGTGRRPVPEPTRHAGPPVTGTAETGAAETGDADTLPVDHADTVLLPLPALGESGSREPAAHRPGDRPDQRSE